MDLVPIRTVLYTVAFNPSVKVLVVMRKLSLCMTVRARLKDLGLRCGSTTDRHVMHKVRHATCHDTWFELLCLAEPGVAADAA